MSNANVKTLLFLSNSKTNASFSFLFHCAKYWAQQGSRVLFISKTPIKCLPFALMHHDSTSSSDSFKLIQFMYLTDWKELLQQLYSIHLRHNPVSVIILRNLETYFKSSSGLKNYVDQSLICSSLLFAASTCTKLTSQPAFLICEHFSDDSTIEKNIIINFFENVWSIKRNKADCFLTLSKLSVAEDKDIVEYKFNENSNESMLIFREILQKVTKKNY